MKTAEKKDINSLRETSWKRISRDPFVDWIFMLAVVIAMVLVTVVIAVSSYIDVGQATSYVSDQTPQSSRPPIDVDMLNRTMKHFEPGDIAGFKVPSDPSL